MYEGFKLHALILAAIAVTALCAHAQTSLYPGEELTLKDIRRISPDVEAREGAISPDGKWICWVGPASDKVASNDQIWIMPAVGGEPRLIAAVPGRVADPVFIPGREAVIFSASDQIVSSTTMPLGLEMESLWRLDNSTIYMVEINGGSMLSLTADTSYNGQPDVSPDGLQVVFASTRDGDLDIYLMDIAGMVPVRLTDTYGYDCQPRFSQDGQWIFFSSYEPKTDPARQQYAKMLGAGLVSAPEFEIYMMRTDGTLRQQITNLHQISLSPCKHPLENLIVFASRSGGTSRNSTTGGGEFDLMAVDFTGTLVKRITTNPGFDGSPCFTRVGNRLVWTSQRIGSGAKSSRSFGVYSAAWQNPLSSTSTPLRP